jgi:hypothetical protein
MDLVHPSPSNFPMWDIHPCDDPLSVTWYTTHAHAPPSYFPYLATALSYFQQGLHMHQSC